MIAGKLKQEPLKKALFLKILKGRLQMSNSKTLQVLAISLIWCKFFLKEVFIFQSYYVSTKERVKCYDKYNI